MKTLGIISDIFRRWFPIIVIVCVSCSKETPPFPHDPADVKENPTTITLTVAHPDVVLFKTKADDKGPYEMPYTEAESAIRNLVFFIFDVDLEGRESIGFDQIFEVSSPVFTTGTYTFEQVVSLKPGRKHIYVAANISPEQRELIYDSCYDYPDFKVDDIILTGNSHEEALANVIRDDMTHSGQGTDILMFAQAFIGDPSNPDTEIFVQGNQPSYYLGAQLKRLVTKVLVTCKEDETGYVYSGGTFIIPTSDIRYCLNTTSKQIFLKERFNSSAEINETPGWLLQDYSDKTGDNTYRQHYAYSSGGDLVSKVQDPRFSAVPEVYDENRLTVDENHYTAGLYCLENTVHAGDGSWTDIDAVAGFATTHIALRIRMIPKTIKHTGLSETLLTSDNWSSVLAAGKDASNVHYPAGTYWVCTKEGSTTFYSYSGYQEMIAGGSAAETDFVKYEGGYNWFYTFIEGGLQTSDGTILSYEGDSYWGIARNEYYIVNISSITRTGEPTPDGDYIRINSETIPWIGRGTQEVVIKPKVE